MAEPSSNHSWYQIGFHQTSVVRLCSVQVLDPGGKALLLSSIVKRPEEIMRRANEQQMRQNIELRLAKYSYTYTCFEGTGERKR